MSVPHLFIYFFSATDHRHIPFVLLPCCVSCSLLLLSMSCPLFKLPLFFLCNNGHYRERELESETEWERCIFPRVCFLWVVLCFFSHAEGRRRGVYRPRLILKSPSLRPSLSSSCPSLQKGLPRYLRRPHT